MPRHNPVPILEPADVLRSAGWLNVSQVAERYGVETVTVRMWIRRKLFPSELMNGKRYANESALENFTPPANGRPRKEKE